MLSAAFNSVCLIHSRPAYLKRPGSPDIYSPVRTTPSNYFRYLAGPSETVITGKEIIIPIVTMLGQPLLVVTVNVAPTAGTFKLSLAIDGGSMLTTADIDFDADQTDIQSAIRLLSGFENVTVVGDLQSSSLRVLFVGSKTLDVANVDISSLTTTASAISTRTNQMFAPIILRGDKIIDATQGSFTVKEIVDMPDIGGDIMGYRVRIE